MRWLRNLLAFGHWGGGIALAGTGWFVGAVACDESCYGDGDWSSNADAWPWELAQALALGLLAVVTFFFVAALAGKTALATFLFVIQAAATGTVLAIFIDAEAVTIAPPIVLLILLAEASGVLALLVGRSRLSGP